jgi:peptidoglycan/LPS O-acetylase OafA/YrhL
LKQGSILLPALTSIRGIAAWWVVLYHFKNYLPIAPGTVAWAVVAKGFLAVDLFFVLSGFILSHVHGRDFAAINRQGILRFLSLRLSRVYPIHILVLVAYLSVPFAVLALSSAKTVDDRFSIVAFGASALLIHDWGIFDQLTWNIPSWSISAEWFAYLLFPFIAASLRHVTTRTQAIAGVLGTLAALIALFAGAGIPSIGDNISHVGVLRGALQFLSGCFIYRFFALASGGNAANSTIALVLFGTLLLGAIIGRERVADFWIFPAAFCCLILSLADAESPLARLLAARPLVYLGDISYSTYMIHYLVFDYFKFLFVRADHSASLLAVFGALAAILCLSMLMYAFIEVPSRQSLRRHLERIIAAATVH